MRIMRRRGWEIPEAAGHAGGAGVCAAAACWPARWHCRRGVRYDSPWPAATPAPPAPPCRPPDPLGAAGPRNEKYPPGRAVTDEKAATTYNNYYEFDDSKDLWRAAQKIPQRPWTISIGGMVAKPRTIAIDDLLKQVQFEERIYRHRCVEAWAMTVPWTGFPLSQLVKLADPLGSAKYVVFETRAGPQDHARPGQPVLSLALHRGRHDGRGRATTSPSSPPACTASRCRRRTAARSG